MEDDNRVKILAFAGATRKESLNKKLARVAAHYAQSAGAEVHIIDLKDFPMPLYDGDMEAESGLPEKALELKALMQQSDGFLIASPEYNSGYSGVLKNAIDWVSRPSAPGEPGLSAFTGKYAGLLATSPGALGGLRGLFALRELLQNINVTVLPGMQAVGKGHEAFDDNIQLKDPKTAAGVQKLAENLVTTLKRVRA